MRVDGNWQVLVSAGSLRPDPGDGVVLPHQWTTEGVVVQTHFTGAHLCHLATAGCVLNDLYREADRLGLKVDGARVRSSGGFDMDTWASTGVEYTVDLDSEALDVGIERLLRIVDQVAEIPQALRSGTTVVRRAAN